MNVPVPVSVYDRATLLTAESCFTCNTYYLATAYDGLTYNYVFDVTGATLHGFDVPYTFFTDPIGSVRFEEVARDLQRYITSFVISGKPQGEGLPTFAIYRDQGKVLRFSEKGHTMVPDETANDRCMWWQTAFDV